MKVHLIKTPEYSAESFHEVIEILRNFSGPLNFVSSLHEFRTEDFFFLTRGLSTYDHLDKKFEKIQEAFEVNRGMPLSWRELFSLCSSYRDLYNIPPDDFVILLTERKNTMNWFSMFEPDRNAFVHCADWDQFTNAASHYPIAYEVVANVLRILMKPAMELNSRYFHEETIGCMNDLCMKKTAILLKLRTGDICEDCLEKLMEEGVHHRVIEQAFRIFEGIRDQLLLKQGLKRFVKPGTIKLTRNRKLLLTDQGSLELKLAPLHKILYIFYLKHPEGIRLNELHDHSDELLSLYRSFASSDSNDAIEASIKLLVDAVEGSFSEKKSFINSSINKQLGKLLAPFYQIQGEPGERFKINLPAHLFENEFEEVRLQNAGV